MHKSNQILNFVLSKSQMWFETDRSEFVLAQLLCLNAHQPEPNLYKCHEMGGDQEWKHKGEVSFHRHLLVCLSFS